MRPFLFLFFLIESCNLLAQKEQFSSLHSATSTRYVLGTNALGLYEKEGVYQNTLLLYNDVSYGVKDWVSLNISSGPVSVDNNVVWLVVPSADFHLPIIKDKLSLAVKTSFAFYDKFQTVYTGYLTVGDRNLNGTFGLSSGIFDYNYDVNFKTKNQVYFYLKFMTRYTQKTYLVLENNFFLENEINYHGLAIIGGRTTFNRFAFTYALAFYHKVDFFSGYSIPFDIDGEFLPFLSISYLF